MNREFDALADDFMTLGLLPPGSDKDIIVPALTGVFQAWPTAVTLTAGNEPFNVYIRYRAASLSGNKKRECLQTKGRFHSALRWPGMNNE